MFRLITLCGLSAAVALVALATQAPAQEEKVALDKVPKPVLEAVKARFKDAKVTDSSKETEKGKVIYGGRPLGAPPKVTRLKPRR